MLTWSNPQTNRDIRAAQRNNARSYEDLRVEDEAAAYHAYKAAYEQYLQLDDKVVTEAQAGMTRAQAKARYMARKREWRALVDSH